MNLTVQAPYVAAAIADCPAAALADGTLGPNTCRFVQAAIFTQGGMTGDKAK